MPTDLSENPTQEIPKMPPGTRYQLWEVMPSHLWWTLQVDDPQKEQWLSQVLQSYSTVWVCTDTDADPEDLSSYWIKVPREIGSEDVVRFCFLWPPLIEGEEYVVRQYTAQPVK